MPRTIKLDELNPLPRAEDEVAALNRDLDAVAEKRGAEVRARVMIDAIVVPVLAGDEAVHQRQDIVHKAFLVLIDVERAGAVGYRDAAQA